MVEYVGYEEMAIYSDIFKDWSGVRPHRDISNWTMEEWYKEINHLKSMIEEEQKELEEEMEHFHVITMEEFRLNQMNFPVPNEEPYESIAEELELKRAI